jgi:hypothetical protein
MLRRHLLALGATATFGAPIKGLGELLAQLGDPAPVPLPSRLSHIHVVKVRDLTQQLLDVARIHGPDLELAQFSPRPLAPRTTGRRAGVPPGSDHRQLSRMARHVAATQV